MNPSAPNFFAFLTKIYAGMGLTYRNELSSQNKSDNCNATKSDINGTPVKSKHKLFCVTANTLRGGLLRKAIPTPRRSFKS